MFEEFLQYQQCMAVLPNWFITVFTIAAIWASIWKGIALWKAGKNGSKPWFIALLVINTLGLLEIIYIFFFSKKQNKAGL